MNDEKEWYFFIYEHKRIENERVVGDGLGFWKANGPEIPVSFTTVRPDISAFKRCFTYFSTTSSNKPANKTHWKMEEFRLEVQSQDKDRNQVH